MKFLRPLNLCRAEITWIDGLGKELYLEFWDKIGDKLYNSILQSKEEGILAPSQTQSIIKLIPKKDRDKQRIQNSRPISLVNGDTKGVTKTLATKLKTVLPSIIHSDQTAYVYGRFIGESTRLISDIMEIYS